MTRAAMLIPALALLAAGLAPAARAAAEPCLRPVVACEQWIDLGHAGGRSKI